MKHYTTFEQSKKLLELGLSPESADMSYEYMDECDGNFPYYSTPGCYPPENNEDVPCWSLAALLDVLNKTAYFINEDASVNLSSYKTTEWDLGIDNSDLELVTESNPIDACVEMIVKLKEGRLL